MPNGDHAKDRVGQHLTPADQVRARVGYVPYSADLIHPGDRRRFPAYARARGIEFEIARPDRVYDVVILSETADLGMWLHYSKGKLIFELIDSYLAIPITDPKQLLRGFAWFAKGRHSRLFLNFRRALERMCRHAHAVVCTTEEQRQAIAPLCQNVHIVLDLHDCIVGSVKTNYRIQGPVQLVWEGLPSNVNQLETIASVLQAVSTRRPVRLNVVTDLHLPRSVPWLRRHETADLARRIFKNSVVCAWDAATWSQSITRCDIAIVPIDLDDPLAAGKSANKLALLWRAGMPVITSATPAYARMQEAAGLSSFACKNAQEWIMALEKLMTDEAVRRDAAGRGHDYIRRALNTEALLASWDAVMASVGIQGSRPA